MIFLICIFIGATVLFGAKFLSGMIVAMKSEGKVYEAIAKKDSKQKKTNSLMPTIFRWADNFSKPLIKIENERFTKYICQLGDILKASGQKYERFNAYQFVILQFFAMLAGAMFCALFISTNFIVMLIVGLIVFATPYMRLKEEAKKRKASILKQLPDAVDLLSVMLDAGLDFFGALDKVSDILKGALPDEMKAASAKIALGYDRRKALIEMSDNCAIEQAVSFVKTVNMALESGSGMADTLKRLSQQIRKEREMAAEKKAQEAPVKILIPLILFIFPTIFIVIFGPIVINLVQNGGF
jgi:tight adherence protein C